VDGVSLFEPAVVEDPYPYYAWLRERAPVHYSPPLDAWLLSRHEHVSRAFRMHDVLSSAPPGGSPPGSRFLLNSDPPEHTVLRRLVNRFFSAEASRRLEGRIRAITGELLDDLLAASSRGEADFMLQVANPLPVVVIAELLGIPPERRDDFKRWSDATIGGAEMSTREIAVASLEMGRYFGEIVDQRRAEPGDDLVSRLVRAGGDEMTRQELASFCTLLLIAGNETTTNLIGNLVLALLTHPEQLELLRRDPALVPAAVEEAMRFDAPVQGVWRLALRDVTLGGTTIPRGARVVLLQAAANRDGDHYPDADRFLVERNPRDHVGFGLGIHFCLGTHLARLETRIVVEELLARAAEVHRDGPGERIAPRTGPRPGAAGGSGGPGRRRPRVRRHPIVRGMRLLPVTIVPASGRTRTIPFEPAGIALGGTGSDEERHGGGHGQ
jgi:cytochrome P450